MPSSLNPVATTTIGRPGSGPDQMTPSSVSNFNSAIRNGSATAPVTPSAPSGTGPTAELTALIKQLIPLLQQLLGGNQGGSAAGGEAAPGGAPEGAGHGGAAHGDAAHETARAPAEPSKTNPKSATAGGTDQLNSLISQLIALLQNTQGESTAPKAPAPKAPAQNEKPAEADKSAQSEKPAHTEAPASAHADAASSGEATSELTSLLTQLIALLQKLLGTGGSAEAGKPGAGSLADPAKTEGLVKQLLEQLQGGSIPSTPNSTAPGTANQPYYSPSMGISGAEINAMIAAVNGTGPEVVLSDWAMGTPSYMVPTTSPTAGGQVSNLGSQVGNEAA